MTHALLPSGMLAVTEDCGPRLHEGIPTAPIGSLWPEWWPTPRPPSPPPAPTPKAIEDEDCGCDVQDATLRPRDMEYGSQQYKGRRVTVEDVPPYQLTAPSPWARRPDSTSI